MNQINPNHPALNYHLFSTLIFVRRIRKYRINRSVHNQTFLSASSNPSMPVVYENDL